MDVTVPLAMFCLDALQLNEELCSRTQNLKDTLIEFEVKENRQLNQRYLSAWIDAVCLWLRYLYSSAGFFSADQTSARWAAWLNRELWLELSFKKKKVQFMKKFNIFVSNTKSFY